MLVAFLQLAIEGTSGFVKYGLLAIGGVVAAILLIRQVWDRPTGLAKKLENWDQDLLHKMTTQRGLGEKLARFDIDYANHQFRIVPPLDDTAFLLSPNPKLLNH